MGLKTTINVNDMIIGYIESYVIGTKQLPQRKEAGQRDTKTNRGRLGGIRQTPGYLQKQPCHLSDDTGVQLQCAASYDIWSEIRTLTKQAQNKLAAAQTKMEISISHTRIERLTSGSGRGQKS